MPGKIFVNYRRDDARDMAARIRDRPTPRGVLLVPKLQAIDDRIAQLTDAELQCSTIAHRRAGIESDQVVDRTQGEIRRTVEIELVARMLDQIVESCFRQLGGAEHEGQLSVVLADQEDVTARLALAHELRQEIRR